MTAAHYFYYAQLVDNRVDNRRRWQPLPNNNFCTIFFNFVTFLGVSGFKM